MKKLLTAALMSAALSSGAFAQLQTNAFDFGANYGGVGEPSWTNNANAGFGFGPWTINNNNNGTSIFAGNFIGNPADAGISGMSTESFGLYANPAGSGAFVNASRSLNTALQVGETFSFQWGINWDGNNGSFGNKGFNLNVGGTQVVNVNNGGNSDIQFNSINTGMNFGTQAMTWSFTYTNASTLSVIGTARDGGASFSTNVTVTGGVSSFQLYASDMAGDTQRQPYFNDFSVTAVPEPSTYALLALSGIAFGGYAIRRRRR
jgi:hypothetical protein